MWRISFDNTHEVRSVAEEYISAIQIVLSEIALTEVDFHLLKSTIEIDLSLNDKYLPPEQLPSNNTIKWKVYICLSNVVGAEKINQHSAFNMASFRLILENISVLKTQEFDQMFWKFFTEANLDTKQVAINLYQKIHRDVYTKEDFEVFQPSSFKKELLELNFPSINNVMIWNGSLSAKYDKALSIEAIKNRFNNAHKSTYLTMKELRRDPDFPGWLNALRSEGFKDWQILVNILNFMINYKVQVFEGREFDSQNEQVEQLQKSFHKYMSMDEKDCYVKFPLEAFQSKEFMHQFNIGLISVLNTYGLENKLMTPNFESIKEFLNDRFNFSNDDYNENSPFKDIQ